MSPPVPHALRAAIDRQPSCNKLQQAAGIGAAHGRACEARHSAMNSLTMVGPSSLTIVGPSLLTIVGPTSFAGRSELTDGRRSKDLRQSVGCARRGGGCLAEPGRLGRRGLDAANRSYDLTNEITASRTSVGVPSGRVKRDTHRRVWAMQSESRRQDPSRNFVPQNPPNAVPKQISPLMASHDVHAMRIPSSRGKSERPQILFRPRFENARSNPRFR